MAILSQDNIFKLLEWILVLGLIMCSIFFTTDVWTKYQAKKTSFITYQEMRKEMPTTVLCFAPFGKKSVLTKYNISMHNMVYADFQDEILDLSWNEFSNDVLYVLLKDFNITFKSKVLLYGVNNIQDGQNIILEKLLTVWSGLCYKITLDYFTYDRVGFELVFDASIASEDIPLPEIYITSEDNAYGILGYGWVNGEELKFGLEGYEQDFKLYASKRTFLNVSFVDDQTRAKKLCSKYLSGICEWKNISNDEYKYCNNTCLAMTMPPSSKAASKLFSECVTLSDYVCMKWTFNSIMYAIVENCPKHCSATEFNGKRTFILHSNEDTKNSFIWYYVFSSKEIQVNEEYFLYDETGLIGAIGGTLGLFIGFSFRDIIGYVIKGLKCVSHEKWR